MIYKTYLNKVNTIIKDSELNVGINPISQLNYGRGLSRILVDFDCNKLKELYFNKDITDLNKVKHILKLTNCGSIDLTDLHCGKISDISDSNKIRATSFDLIFFAIPKDWDGGKGFDYRYTFFNQGYYTSDCMSQLTNSKKLISTDGSNWYQAKNGDKWDEEGIYSSITLENEYNKFSLNNSSDIIIGRQHFDIGNENIEIDITQFINDIILDKKENHGIGIAFSPALEQTNTLIDNYVGFFTHKTNTFFEPYIETKYENYISDDRSNFILDKHNKLYFYANIGGELKSLDNIPTCTINGIEYNVTEEFKGVYSINILLSSKDYQPNCMIYDIWSNIKYQGVIFDDVEMDFVTVTNANWFNFTNKTEETEKYLPTIFGIKSNEKIKRGDIRKLNIIAQKPYTYNKAVLINNMELRLYVKDGNREITIIDFDKIHKTFNENYYLLDTNMLLPNEYYIDIKIKYDKEVIIHNNILNFTIVNETSNKYY